MDYLDPRKRRRHTIMLYVGYALIAVGITIATTVLVYQAYGFGIDKKGAVIQSGLLFVSSQPQAASIVIDDELNKSRTNSRLKLAAATYQLKLQRAGYHDWTRQIDITGGSVKRLDYPLLIPNELVTKKLAEYSVAPSLVTQSPDKRWILINQPDTAAGFDSYDLRSPARSPEVITLPPELYSPATSTQSWEAIEWADNNNNILVRHLFDGNFEYILINRDKPAESVNLTRLLNVNPTRLQLIDRKFDMYYLFDAEKQTLDRARLNAPQITPILTEILDFKSYSDDTILYASSRGASSGQTRIRLLAAEKTYTIRSVAASPAYVLDITQYKDSFYVVVGASVENKAYIYRDPVDRIATNPFKLPVPNQVLRITSPKAVSFSSSAQYISVQNGTDFAVYDLEYDETFNYTVKSPIDAPQQTAAWMDGNRLSYVSGGKRLILDYDNRNVRDLGDSAPQYRALFAPDFTFSYGVTVAADGKAALVQTALLAPGDL